MGQGRATGENWENCKNKIIKQNPQNIICFLASQPMVKLKPKQSPAIQFGSLILENMV